MAKLYPPSQKTACASLRMNASKFCFGGILHPTKQGRRNPNREVGELHPRGRNDGHKLDYSKITENIYVGSDFCNGRDCKEHAGEFKKLEIDVEINLTAEKKETPPDGVNSYTWIPVMDGYAPSQEQLDIGTAIINQATKNGEKVYVHCKNGHGRSPTLVAAYLIGYKKMSAKEAVELIKKNRPEIHVEEMQFEELRAFEKKQSLSSN